MPAPPLAALIPEKGFPSPSDALDAFVSWTADMGLSLYEAQEEAILEIFADHHVLLKTPTGSGKSLVAVAMHFHAFALARRSVYTAPIKALVSEKFFELCRTFGAEHVGLMTGDGSVNPDAPILCCTAEILALMALRHGSDTPFAAVVMDEFHYYGDASRGMAWQLPLITMDKARFLLMSATLGDTRAIASDLTRRTGAEVADVSNAVRPVPLRFEYSERPLHTVLDDLVGHGKAPVYCVHFSQREAGERAQALMSSHLCTDEEKVALKAAVKGFRFDSPYGSTLRRALLHGVGIHHAGLLPKYRLLVEKLAQQGLFKIIAGTDTLGVGINVPIRTVLFTKLCKYDGREVNILSVRDFHQIAGRAGRKGFDDEGLVVAQAPEWVIDNALLKRAVSEGKKKKSKVKLSAAPTKGYKHWDEQTFERLISGQPEALQPRFAVGHGLLLSLIQRAEAVGTDAETELDALIDASHASDADKATLKEEGRLKLTQLLEADVVVRGEAEGLGVHADLQDDFSLHHTLSLFLVHLVGQLDPASPTYTLDVISCVEAILEHPKPVLQAQVQREKSALMAEMKAAGVDYEDRLARLDEVTWPKPRAEWLYAQFEDYAATRPWLEAEGGAARAKGVAREMYESQQVFSAYIKSLRIDRIEGVLLRYLSQVYRALAQNVPREARTPELDDAIGWFRAMLARVDDSLLRTWESLRSGDDAPDAPPKPVDISADDKAFRARVRGELHALVSALASGDLDEAAASVRDRPGAWTSDDFRTALAPFVDDRGPLVWDGPARMAWNTVITPDGPHRWRVSQRIFGELDRTEEDEAGWSLDAVIDLRDDTNPSGVIIEVVSVGEG